MGHLERQTLQLTIVHNHILLCLYNSIITISLSATVTKDQKCLKRTTNSWSLCLVLPILWMDIITSVCLQGSCASKQLFSATECIEPEQIEKESCVL